MFGPLLAATIAAGCPSDALEDETLTGMISTAGSAVAVDKEAH